MVLPTTEMPVPERSVYNYIAQLGIEVHLQKLNDKGMPRRHVTKAEADQLLALFKAKHWRKFKAVEPKHKGD